MILIVTNKNDSHADAVIHALRRNEVAVFRLNTEDILSKYNFQLQINAQGEWYGVVEDELGRPLNLCNLRSAWLRKPVFGTLGLRDLNESAARFVLSESRSLVDILYSLPNVTWVNDPFCANRAKVKFQQLILANKLGVKTPRTIITANPDFAREFVTAFSSDVLTKSVYTSNVTFDGVNQGILSRKLSPSEFEEHCDTISMCPTLIQEYCEKDHELRVTVIGSKVFAVKIDSQMNMETKIDWRSNTLLSPHSKCQLPERIERFCLEFMSNQQLIYGAMDFIVTPNHEYIFLENNPFGNYQWLDDVENINLTAEMAKLLTYYSQTQ